jgi:hypothetical protein
MTPRFLPSPRSAHRLLCVLMAWVMLVAPVIVLASELHEIEHATHSDGSVVETAHASGAAPAADADGDALHDLAHAAQCCSHTAAVLPGSPAIVLISPRPDALNWTGSSRDRRLTFLPFRPPIGT